MTNIFARRNATLFYKILILTKKVLDFVIPRVAGSEKAAAWVYQNDPSLEEIEEQSARPGWVNLAETAT